MIEISSKGPTPILVLWDKKDVITVSDLCKLCMSLKRRERELKENLYVHEVW